MDSGLVALAGEKAGKQKFNLTTSGDRCHKLTSESRPLNIVAKIKNVNIQQKGRVKSMKIPSLFNNSLTLVISGEFRS